MSDLLNLIRADGIELKHKCGDEWAGPCPDPDCGGTDRFIVHPEQGRYWCRQCGRHGDAWQYLKDFRGMTDREAAVYLGIAQTPSSPSLALPRAGGTGRPNRSGAATPKSGAAQNAAQTAGAAPTTWTQTDREAWLAQAEALTRRAHEALLASPAALARLEKSRGLTEATARRFRLGMIPATEFPAPAAWGLVPPAGKKLVLPAGLLIPTPGRLRIRRRDDKEADKYGRYCLIRGSDARRPFIIGGEHPPEATPALIVESELDAMLLAQELPPITIVALGSTSTKPTAHPDLVQNLRRRSAVILVQDADESGRKSAREWKQSVPKATLAIIPPEYGKDPTEVFLHGQNLLLWYASALQKTMNERRPTPPAPTTEQGPITTPQPQTYIIPQRPDDLPTFCAGHDCRHFRLYRTEGRPPEPWCHWKSDDLTAWRNDAIWPDRMQECPQDEYEHSR